MNNILLVGQNRLANVDWNIGNIAITVVIIAAVVALVYVALRKFGVAIPDWVIQIFWIVVIALVVIAAIRFVVGM